MIVDLDPSLLRAFVAVAELGSMSRAAEVLHRTQSAVSQKIKRLEEQLGCVLFDRKTRGLKLTKAGARLLELSRAYLDANDTICREMMTPALRGTVRLGLPYDLVTAYLPTLLQGFAENFPEVDVTLTCETSPELITLLKRREIDVALAEEAAEAPKGEVMRVERLVWIAQKNGNAFQQRPLPLSIVAESCAFRPGIIKALRGSRIRWRSVFENGNIEATMTTVRADMAVTTSLASLVPDGVDVLGAKEGLPDLPEYAICLHVPKDDSSPLVQAFANHVRSNVPINAHRSPKDSGVVVRVQAPLHKR